MHESDDTPKKRTMTVVRGTGTDSALDKVVPLELYFNQIFDTFQSQADGGGARDKASINSENFDAGGFWSRSRWKTLVDDNLANVRTKGFTSEQILKIINEAARVTSYLEVNHRLIDDVS